MRVRNPVVAVLLLIVALGALTMAFMVGMILLSALAVAGLLLAAGMILRRKLGRARGELPPSHHARAELDPAMEVRPEQRVLPRDTSNGDPE